MTSNPWGPPRPYSDDRFSGGQKYWRPDLGVATFIFRVQCAYLDLWNWMIRRSL